MSSCVGRVEAGLPRGVVLMDAGYGANTDLACKHHDVRIVLRSWHYAEHNGLGARHRAVAAEEMVGRGRPPKLIRRDARHRPISVKAPARGLPKGAWRTIEWREGAAERLSSRFARAGSCRAS